MPEPGSQESEGRVKPCVVTSNYPTVTHPNRGTFVESLVRAWHRMGTQVAVIAPNPLWSSSRKRLELRPPAPATRGAPVIQPTYLSLSAYKIGPVSTRRWTQATFVGAVRRALPRLPFQPSIIYSHFLYPAGDAGLRVARSLGLPAVVALGESDFSHWDRHFGFEATRSVLHGFDAILSVSEENKTNCSSLYGVPESRINVVPNAIDTSVFTTVDRATARQRLGLPQDRPIIAFTGHFIERKGPLPMRISPTKGVI